MKACPKLVEKLIWIGLLSQDMPRQADYPLQDRALMIEILPEWQVLGPLQIGTRGDY